jgi:hypothetical protein
MELFQYLIVILIISLIILIVYFNDKIKTAFFDYYMEPFAVAPGTEEKIGLKWLYLGNSEPNGDKITNEKLYILLNYKWVSPIIINIDELDSLGIKNLTYDSYINVDDRYFKPYNVATDNTDIGLMWRDLGINTEKYVKGSYKEVRNDKIKNAIEVKAKNNLHETIDGEKIIVFTQKEYDDIKNATPLTYDSYILISDDYGEANSDGEDADGTQEKRIYQPYYKHKIVKTDEIFSDINIDKILTKGFDNSFLKSTGIKTHNMKNDDYFNTEIYNNKGVSNNELHFNTESFNYRQSNDNSYKSILDPIDDNYMPSVSQTNNFNNDPKYMSEKTINQFVIIDIYKNILGRQPKPREIIVNLQEFYEKNSDEEKLKLKLYNSTEYKMIVKMQSNDIDPTLVSKISEKNIIDMLTKVYKNHFNKMPHNKMTIPLKQCYIHLQFNDYLFKAMLMHDNYPSFERDILREYIINDEKLLEIFDNNFVLYELRLIANELKRREMLKREALSTPVALTTDAAKNSAESSNSADTNLNAQKHIADIMKNSEPVFNINITLQDKNVSAPYGSGSGSGSGSGGARTARITTNNSLDPRNNSGAAAAAAGAFNPADPTVSLNIPNARGAAASASASSSASASASTSNILTAASDSSNYSISGGQPRRLGQSGINTRIADGSGINDAPVYSTDELYNSIGDGRVVEYTDSDGMQHTQIMPDRIYDPINYKQQYRGDSAYRPNVCSYGSKQIVNPIYLSAEGTDLREAIENTQVGSIMPKFAYREYEDVK